MYRSGLVSISFRGHSPAEILEAAARAGLSCIEWGSDVHAPCGDVENLEKIVKLQEKYGISCCSYGTYFRLGVTPIAELPAYIQAAKTLGTNILPDIKPVRSETTTLSLYLSHKSQKSSNLSIIFSSTPAIPASVSGRGSSP